MTTKGEMFTGELLPNALHIFVPMEMMKKEEMTMKKELLSKNSYQNLAIIVYSFVWATVFTLHTTKTITTTILHIIIQHYMAINNIYKRQIEHFKSICD